MRLHSIRLSGIAASVIASTLLIGCATTPPQDTEFDQAQAAYASASNNPKVAQAAPKQLQRASAALDRSTALRKEGASRADVNHYAYLAIQQVAIARQLTAADAAQAYIKQAGEQRSQMLLQASQQQARQAQMRTENARAEARQAQMQTATATAQAEQAQQQNVKLQQQLAALNAKQTNRGMVLTLGSVLFGTNKADLKSGSARSLDKLAQFMRNNPKRNVMVEGYTDSTGSANYNLQLSQRRADAVRAALISDGINPQRIVTKGFGVRYPVASNRTAAGRQQNRRVEIVISGANGNFPRTR